MYSQLKIYARNTYMKGQNLSGPRLNIFDSDFSDTKVKDSFFNRASFRNCNLSRASFSNVSFEEGYLYRLIMDMTSFEDCNFAKACMEDFTFDNCVFVRCNFTLCDMQNIAFKYCSFYECNFRGSELPPSFHPHRMTDCKNVPYMPMACPEEGKFIGYKIASTKQAVSLFQLDYDTTNNGPANVLVTLKIPADAKRSSAGGRKCRCDKAEVIGLEHIGSHENLSVAYSKYDYRFVYHIGEEISVPNFNENRWDECSSGIHFFINKKEALQYYNVMGVYYGRNE